MQIANRKDQLEHSLQQRIGGLESHAGSISLYEPTLRVLRYGHGRRLLHLEHQQEHGQARQSHQLQHQARQFGQDQIIHAVVSNRFSLTDLVVFVFRMTCADQTFFCGFATTDLTVKLYAMNFRKGSQINRQKVDTENKKSRKLLNTLPLTLQYMEAANDDLEYMGQ